MPVLNENGACVGLIDAESWTPCFFDNEKVATVACCALTLAADLSKFPIGPVSYSGGPGATDGTPGDDDDKENAMGDRRFFNNGTLQPGRKQ
mmetsp:Transcript_84463/g.176773  ORF Transcript_84463/g.176773 Transcript_84463/m.176773 type:complete len:92 (+) Transcript_84463:597-872(+)